MDIQILLPSRQTVCRDRHLFGNEGEFLNVVDELRAFTESRSNSGSSQFEYIVTGASPICLLAVDRGFYLQIKQSC